MSKAFVSPSPCLSRVMNRAEALNRRILSAKPEETVEPVFSAAPIFTTPLQHGVKERAARLGRS